MKRKSLLSIALLICLLVAVGCGSSGEGSATATQAVTSTAPATNATATVGAGLPTATTSAPEPTNVPSTLALSTSVPIEAVNATATTPAIPTGQPTSGGDPATAIANSLRALLHVKSYRLFQTIVSAGSSITQTAEIIPPDRMHMTNSYSGSSVVGETIIVSPTMWIRAQDGSWVVSDASDISGMLQLNSDQALVDLYIKSISGARLSGTETINGVATQVYEYNIELAEYNTKGSETLWIGTADGLPYKRVSTNSVITGDQSATSKTTALYSDFNTEITIEPPDTESVSVDVSPTNAAVGAEIVDKIDACTLISKEESAQALGVEIGDAQGLNSDGEGTHISTCAYASGTTDGKSVYISLTQLATADKAQSIYEFSTTGADGHAVPDVGDGAFWNGTTKQLLVWKGSVYFYLRVSGTASDMDAAIPLAAKVVERLP